MCRIFSKVVQIMLFSRIHTNQGLPSIKINKKMDAALNLLLYLAPKYGLQYPAITRFIFCDMIRTFWKDATA